VAKKRSAARKTSRAKKTSPRSSRPKKKAADASRLDTGPLQEHIRKRIRDVEGRRSAAAAPRPEDEKTLARLKQTLETLEDICHPSMTVPI
jgi:hypothetical protein